MLIGTVVRWDHKKGFGFIERDDGAPDVFVHCCALRDRSADFLPIGTRVQFDIETDERKNKLRAIWVAELTAANSVHRSSPRPSPREAAQAYFRDA
jgi:CspA family cold shock protein